MIVDFTRNNEGKYVGCAVFDNGHYFGSGRTIEHMLKNVAFTVRFYKKNVKLHLREASSPLSLDDFKDKYYAFMAKTTRTRMFGSDRATVTVTETAPELPKESTVDNNDSGYTYAIVDGYLCVYERKLVQKFKLDAGIMR